MTAKEKIDIFLSWLASFPLRSVFGLGILAGASLLLMKATGTEPGLTSVRFVALLLVTLTALAASVMVFSGLKLAAPSEAFGLPSGSIRALLAMGVMVLLVVLGLHFIPTERSLTLFKEISVKADNVVAETTRYQAAGFVVVVIEPPAPPSGQAASTPADPKLQLFRASGPAPADTDLIKQILTAVVTLLTSVISFYFGARSAGESKDSAAASPPGALPPALLASRETLTKPLETAKANVDALKAKLSELTLRPPPAQETDDGKKAREDAAAKAAEGVAEAEALLKTAADNLAKFDEAAGSAAAATDADAIAQKKAVAEQALTAAKSALDKLVIANSGATSLLETLTTLTAEG